MKLFLTFIVFIGLKMREIFFGLLKAFWSIIAGVFYHIPKWLNSHWKHTFMFAGIILGIFVGFVLWLWVGAWLATDVFGYETGTKMRDLVFNSYLIVSFMILGGYILLPEPFKRWLADNWKRANEITGRIK